MLTSESAIPLSHTWSSRWRSSLATDRGTKRRLYASCGVPEYWVVNLPERCIEVYTEPKPGAYGRCERYEREQSIQLTGFPDIALAVNDVLR